MPAGRKKTAGRLGSARRSWFRRRVPFVQQLSSVECGAACLSMVLRYHGCKVPMAELRETCGVGRDGVSVLTLLRAARSFGLEAKAYSVELWALAGFQLPVILHWRFSHFVVLERCTDSGVIIVDPAGGRRRLTFEELDEDFTGVLIGLVPGAGFPIRQPTATDRAWTRFFASVFLSWSAAGVLGQIVAASLVLQLVGLVFPAITALAVDWVLPMGVSGAMGVLALAMGVTLLSKALLSLLRATLLLRLRMHLDTRMMTTFFEHLLSLPFRFFQMRNQGDLLMRLSSNSMIRETLTNQSLSVVLDGSFVMVTWLILFGFASDLALLVAVLGTVQMLLALATLRPMQRLMERDLAAKAEEQSYLVETLGGIATLKVAGGERHAFDRWSDLFFAHLRLSVRRGQIAAAIETAMATLRTGSPLVLLWYGVGQVLEGSWTLGSMLAWNAIASNFLSPLGSLVASLQSFQLLGAHLARVGDVLEAEPEQHVEPSTTVPDRLRGSIDVEGVSFRYQPDGPEVLSDIRFSVRPGEKVAIVGATGSGKSTLGLVLLGMLPVENGEVRFDGIPAGQLGLRFLRGQVGAVLQSPSLFSGSIRRNISFLRPEMPLEEVIEAARAVAIHDEIAAMPMAYETRVAEGGSAISGGQKQRLALARALASKPSILLLDEATSHLDPKTEAIVDRHLSTLRCTRIVIAHRLSTVHNADRILVLEGGRLVEQGTHDELIAIQGGVYAEQARTQQKAPPAGRTANRAPALVG